MAKTELDWAEFDADTLPANLKALVAEQRKAQEIANAAKEKLRKAMEKHFVEHKILNGATETLKISFKFGKLSVAKKEADAPKVAAKPKLTWNLK